MAHQPAIMARVSAAAAACGVSCGGICEDDNIGAMASPAAA